MHMIGSPTGVYMCCLVSIILEHDFFLFFFGRLETFWLVGVSTSFYEAANVVAPCPYVFMLVFRHVLYSSFLGVSQFCVSVFTVPPVTALSVRFISGLVRSQQTVLTGGIQHTHPSLPAPRSLHLK